MTTGGMHDNARVLPLHDRHRFPATEGKSASLHNVRRWSAANTGSEIEWTVGFCLNADQSLKESMGKSRAAA
jgi:hypothetical protein